MLPPERTHTVGPDHLRAMFFGLGDLFRDRPVQRVFLYVFHANAE